MPKVIGVRFRTSPRMYYFSPTENVEYPKDTKIIVETQRGIELATVVMPITEVPDDKIVAPLKGVLRIATEGDLEAANADDEKKHEILSTAKQKVAARGLEMKIVDCEFTVDHSKLVLYFTAEQRVDFRELVRDLASAFHMRIDLRQIGAREECKLIGSLGVCGMPCCCGRFESDSDHVSIKMAKCQNLALTPNKINGMCGRLLCCLSYENKTYEDVMRRSPKVGSWVTCSDGRRGTVVSVTPLTEKVRLRIGDDDNFEFAEYTLGEIKFDRKDGERSSNTQDEVSDTSTNSDGVQKKARNNNSRGNNGNGGSSGDSGKNDGGQRKPKFKNRQNNNRNNQNRQDPNSQSTESGSDNQIFVKKKKRKFKGGRNKPQE